MRRNIVGACVIMLCIAGTAVVPVGCASLDALLGQRTSLVDSVNAAENELSLLQQDLLIAQQKDDVVLASSLAAKIGSLQKWIAEAKPVIVQIDEKIKASDDGWEITVGILEVVAGLFGFGGVVGVFTDRWRRGRATKEREAIIETLASGPIGTVAPMTLATLPPDFAQALITAMDAKVEAEGV